MKALLVGALFAVTAPLARAEIAPGQVYLYDDRGDIMIDALTHFYGLTPTSANGALSLKADAIDCELAAGALTPQCTVKAAGKTFTAPKLLGLSPDASLFQLLAESGAARSDASRPGVTLASATSIACASGSEGITGCFITPTLGTPVAPRAAVLSVLGYHARDLLVALEAGGSPDTSSGQYGMSTTLDSLNCTAKKVWGDSGFTMNFDCAGGVAAKPVAFSGTNARTVYRILAETGAAKYDQNNQGYVASVSNLNCDFGSTHTSSGEYATCSYTAAARQQVLTHLVFDSFASNDTLDATMNSIWPALTASGAPVSQIGGASTVTVDADCVRDAYNAQTVCTATSAGKDLPNGGLMDSVEAMFARSEGERVMLSKLGAVAAYGSTTCVLAGGNLNHVGCVIRIYRVAPL